MKEKLTQFFDTDFHYVEVGVRKETDHQRISEMIWYARQRALGAVDMAQLCGLPYEEAERMFNEYGARLGVLENEVCG